MNATPALSVVVPTYRRPRLLRRCVASLVEQDAGAAFEVVVVDDGSGDETPQVLVALSREHPGVVVPHVQPRNTGPAAARNRALETARAPLVLFVDDDVAAAPGLLATHLRLHAEAADPMLGILGRVDWHPDLTISTFMRWLDRSGLQFGYDTWLTEGPVQPPYAAFYTANLSMPRALLTDAGGFDERFPHAAYEDMELAFRLTERGFRLDYRPAALAWHMRSMELGSFATRMAKVGESAGLLRAAAPEFPIDDATLRAAWRPRRVRWALHARAARGDEQARDLWYWATIAAAYAHGGRQAPSNRP